MTAAPPAQWTPHAPAHEGMAAGNVLRGGEDLCRTALP